MFDDPFQTHYLKVYRTDLHQICTIGRTMAVDTQSEISFSIPQGTRTWTLPYGNQMSAGDIR